MPSSFQESTTARRPNRWQPSVTTHFRNACISLLLLPAYIRLRPGVTVFLREKPKCRAPRSWMPWKRGLRYGWSAATGLPPAKAKPDPQAWEDVPKLSEGFRPSPNEDLFIDYAL